MDGTIMDRHEIIERVDALAALVRTTFPDLDDLGDVSYFIDMNERQIAVEMLCEYFWEMHGGVVPSNIYVELIAVAQMLNVDKKYWDDLESGPSVMNEHA